MSVLLFGEHPERAGNTTFYSIPKKNRSLKRLLAFFITLRKLARQVDIIFAESGLSVDVPILALSLVTRTPIVRHRADKHQKHTGLLYKIVQRVLTARIPLYIEETPLSRPETFPFAQKPTQEIQDFESSWTAHTCHVESVCKTYATK
jgi:hypothetical protein